jgi:DNA-binding NtrC family response regulator
MAEPCRIGDILRQPPREVLYLEDDGADLELCLKTLVRTELEFHSNPVSTLEEFADKLSAQTYDVILADYQLKGYTGMDALALLREKRKEIPFILMSGALGEEKAVECVKNGVDDFILTDHFARLPLAMRPCCSQPIHRDHRVRPETRLPVELRKICGMAAGRVSK